MRLENSVCVITGGASGIGMAMTRYFHSLGAKVAIWDLNQDGEKLVQELGPRVIFSKTDVTSSQSISDSIQATVQAFGAIHVLVTSAGFARAGPFLSRPDKAQEHTFMPTIKVNVVGTFLCCALVSQQMAKQATVNDDNERGVIITLGSISAYEAPDIFVGYGASKGAVAGMTRPLAEDLAQYGIRVMCICPGMLLTPMSESIANQFVKTIPSGRLGETIEVAHVARSIIENGFFTGSLFVIDGGMTGGPKL